MRPRLLVVLMLAAGFVACGGDNTLESPVVPTFFGPPKSLQVTGELSFNFIGQSRQLTASATFANGQVRNVTSQAQWASSNPSVATVTGGLVRVVSYGETQITATYRNITSAAAGVSAKALPTLVSVSLSGPQEMPPGTTAQFTLNGNYSDGSSTNVTANTNWSTFAPNVLRHAGQGRFEALGVGEAQIFASYQSRFTSARVLVVPAGTFKLSGRVTDSSGPIENVEVRVVSGTGTGLTVKTDFGGNYALYGVAGDVRLIASAPGYISQEFTATVTNHSVRDVALTTSGDSVDVSGQWTMTFRTSSACSDTWSAESRQREITAAVTQTGTRLNIRFLGSTIARNTGAGDASGRIAGTAFSMTLFFDDYYRLYSLLERVNPTDWVGIAGTFEGTANPSGTEINGTFSGTFDSYVTLASSSFPTGPVRTCAADSQVQLRR
jgi:carboxypeptidase-like protein/Big-like domain-containing protein